jgi:hypothetical protein
MDPQKPPRQFSLPGKTRAMRTLFIAGGLLGLVVVLIILKSLFGGGSGLTSFVVVAQDQQELLHLATGVSKMQSGVSTANQNLAATTQLSVGSAQVKLIKYLAANGHNVNSKTINLKVSTSFDSQLQAALANTTYDQTFRQIMRTVLKVYMDDMKTAYSQTTGTNGHALLNDDYNQAQLLVTQLNSPGQ